MKICLVCSSGGHLIEMQKIKSAFDADETFLITHKDKFLNWESEPKKLYQIENVLVGKAHDANRIIKLVYLFYYFLIVTIKEISILAKERPKIIVSTGSAIAIPIFYIGKLLGSKTIFVESVCRVKTLSLAGKILYPITDVFLVQWVGLTAKYKNTKYVGNILPEKRVSECSLDDKEYDVFLMIGTAQFPRLVKMLDEVVGYTNKKAMMQIGRTDYVPKNADYFSFVDDFSKIQELCHNSKVVITHGGAGSIITALEQNSRVIVVPRMKKYNEAYNDHQLELVEELHAIGSIISACDVSELQEAICGVTTWKCRNLRNDINSNSKIINFLKNYVSSQPN